MEKLKVVEYKTNDKILLENQKLKDELTILKVGHAHSRAEKDIHDKEQAVFVKEATDKITELQADLLKWQRRAELLTKITAERLNEIMNADAQKENALLQAKVTDYEKARTKDLTARMEMNKDIMDLILSLDPAKLTDEQRLLAKKYGVCYE